VEMLPPTLLDATRELEQDDVLRTALGTTPKEDYVDYYVRTKQREFSEWHNEVSQWEVNRYLQLY
jgi:glutamine synthetase